MTKISELRLELEILNTKIIEQSSLRASQNREIEKLDKQIRGLLHKRNDIVSQLDLFDSLSSKGESVSDYINEINT